MLQLQKPKTTRGELVECCNSDADPLIDVPVLELDESGADGCDVALLVTEGDAAGALGILQLRVRVDARVAHATVQAVHDHRKFNCQEIQASTSLNCR